MSPLQQELPNLHTVLMHVYNGISKYHMGDVFRLNMDYYFRTIHGDYGFITRLEGDAGMCAIQEIAGMPLLPEYFYYRSTAEHGCNPVQMVADVIRINYDDLFAFLHAVANACRGDMGFLIKYIYPLGFQPKNKTISKNSIRYPTLHIRNNSVHSQLPLLYRYIQYLEAIE